MKAKEKLSELAPIINKEIDSILQNEFEESKHISPFISEMLKEIIKVSSGGKRLRGAFVYLGYLMYGGQDFTDILKASAYVEMMHTHILMMDDIIDQDERRRGVETLHKVFKDYHKSNFKMKEAYHFGISIAICASLVLAYACERIMLKTKFNKELVFKALDIYHKHLVETGYGEVLDVLAEVKDSVSVEETMQINHFKTAAYTYEAPLQLGAVLAGANDEDLKLLSEYAIPAGIAFQIQDDILGMFGDEEKLGKPADSDLKEGKRNALTLKTIEMASDKDKKKFLELLGNVNIKSEDVEEARRIIKVSGALDYNKNLAIDYVNKALAALDKFKFENEGKEFLRGIAEYMINREV